MTMAGLHLLVCTVSNGIAPWPATIVRTYFSSRWIYELPVGKGKKFVNSGPAAYIFGNWKLNGSRSLRSPARHSM